jgi:hypothetical protein
MAWEGHIRKHADCFRPSNSAQTGAMPSDGLFFFFFFFSCKQAWDLCFSELYEAEMDMFVVVLPLDLYCRNATVSVYSYMYIYRPMIPHQGGWKGLEKDLIRFIWFVWLKQDRNSSRIRKVFFWYKTLGIQALSYGFLLKQGRKSSRNRKGFF